MKRGGEAYVFRWMRGDELAAGKLIRSFLFGTQAHDPAVIAAVVLILLLVAAAACRLPVRRASRIDPRACLT
jgi:hypothetical protein